MDGIERDAADIAKVVRVELPTDLGRTIAARYGVEFTPTFLLFDATGAPVRRTQRVDREATVAELRALAGR